MCEIVQQKLKHAPGQQMKRNREGFEKSRKPEGWNKTNPLSSVHF